MRQKENLFSENNKKMLQTYRRHRIGALAEVAGEPDRTDAGEDVAAVRDFVTHRFRPKCY